MDEYLNLLLGPGGVVVILLFILFTGLKKMWVFGYQLVEEKEEKKMWREIALRGTSIAEQVAKLKANGPTDGTP